jgi:hypothetical protein
MKQLLIIGLVLLVSACDKPAPADTPESLAADPVRLKDLRAQCKADHAKVGDAVCNAVAEATRRRFMGSGTPYTPRAPARASAPASVPAASAASSSKD